jgi:hypothetical protein
MAQVNAMTSVALMCMPTPEVSLLRSVFQVVATRGLSFEIAETPDEIARAEIVVLDADNATAMALWSALKEQQPGTIGILVAKKPPAGDGQLWVQRPLNSMKVLAALGKADVKRAPKRSEQALPAEGASMLKDLRVLVIDDSETVRKQLELALGDQGIDVQTAETGELGLHMLSTCHFECRRLPDLQDDQEEQGQATHSGRDADQQVLALRSGQGLAGRLRHLSHQTGGAAPTGGDPAQASGTPCRRGPRPGRRADDRADTAGAGRQGLITGSIANDFGLILEAVFL